MEMIRFCFHIIMLYENNTFDKATEDLLAISLFLIIYNYNAIL